MRRLIAACLFALAVLWTARTAPEATEPRAVDLSRSSSAPSLPPVTAAPIAPSSPAPSGPPSVAQVAEGRYPSPTATPEPTPSPVRARGIASWFASYGSGLYAAAGPALRTGQWRGRTVTVCANGRCVSGVRLIDWCQCLKGQGNRERLVDLSRDAFSRLADPSLGLVTVEVRW